MLCRKIHSTGIAGSLIVLILFLASSPGCVNQPWRSSLYPQDWTPGYEDSQGRFLHDFSYAGYHNGEAPLPVDPPGDIFNVVSGFGADNQGSADATGPIQSAINAASAAGGGIVFLPAGVYRCDGLLHASRSGLVIRGEGEDQTQIYFTQAAGMSDGSHITFSGAVQQGTDLPLAVDGENQSLVVYVSDASSLAVGDDISVGWIITDDFVAEHGMTGTWTVFNGQWKPFFRRKVVALNLGSSPHEVTLDVPLRYPAKLRDQASIRKETGYLQECGIEALSISNAVDRDAAWDEVRVHAVLFQDAKDCWIRHVHSFASPYVSGNEYHLQNGGIDILSSKRFTVTDCRMEKAQNRGDGGCGYLFEISKSNEVLIRDSAGIAGRHNFIQNWDFGTTGCVFLRCESAEGRKFIDRNDQYGLVSYSEYHHSLAMACLVDQCILTDGWYGGNRNLWSSGAGHSVTQSAFWNSSGGGGINSWQYGWGYIMGTETVAVLTALIGPDASGTAPEDFVEGLNAGDLLQPPSLYEDQQARRLGR